MLVFSLGLTILKDVDSKHLLKKGLPMPGAERLVCQVTEDPDQEPVQGWRSTKRPRQPPADNADHLTHTCKAIPDIPQLKSHGSSRL